MVNNCVDANNNIFTACSILFADFVQIFVKSLCKISLIYECVIYFLLYHAPAVNTLFHLVLAFSFTYFFHHLKYNFMIQDAKSFYRTIQ